jgi:hypothetical protein
MHDACGRGTFVAVGRWDQFCSLRDAAEAAGYNGTLSACADTNGGRSRDSDRWAEILL